MIASDARATVQVDIPNTCTMHADFTPDVDLRFQFGQPGRDLLAAPAPDDEPGQTSQPAVRAAEYPPLR